MAYINIGIEENDKSKKSPGAVAQIFEALRTGDADKGNNVGNKAEGIQVNVDGSPERPSGAMAQALEAFRTGNAELANNVGKHINGIQVNVGGQENSRSAGAGKQIFEALRTGDADKGNNAGKQQGVQVNLNGQESRASGAMAQALEAFRTGDANKGNNVGKNVIGVNDLGNKSSDFNKTPTSTSSIPKQFSQQQPFNNKNSGFER